MIVSEVSDLYDPSCSLDANHQHLKHVFEGYRAFGLGEPKSANPYSKGSPRWASWDGGWRFAEADQKGKHQ